MFHVLASFNLTGHPVKSSEAGSEDENFEAFLHAVFTCARATRVRTSVTCDKTTLASCSFASNVGGVCVSACAAIVAFAASSSDLVALSSFSS